MTGSLVEEGVPLLGALSHDPKRPGGQIHAIGRDGRKLRNPESRGIEEGEDRPVPHPFGPMGIRSLDEALDLVLGEDLGEGAGEAGSGRRFPGVLADAGEFEKARPGPDRGEESGSGTYGKVPASLKIAGEGLSVEVEKRDSLTGQVSGKCPEVGEVGRDGVRGALFGEEKLLLESVQKPLDLVGGSSDHGGRLLGRKET